VCVCVCVCVCVRACARFGREDHLVSLCLKRRLANEELVAEHTKRPQVDILVVRFA
jgi:hypothetical protein